MNKFANWRALVPSWKFFDKVGPGFELQFRVAGTIHDPEAWHLVRLEFRSSPFSLFFNPQQNLIHALDSLVERIVIETQSLDAQTQLDFEKSVTYSLILNWVRRCAKEFVRANSGTIGDSAFVQFRICTRPTHRQAAQQNASIQVVLLSLEHLI